MTGDNNPDYGDPARWVYVVEGGDSGGASAIRKPAAQAAAGRGCGKASGKLPIN